MTATELEHSSISQGFQLPLLEGKPVSMTEFDSQLDMPGEEIFEVFSSKIQGVSVQLEMGTMQDGFDLNGVTH